MRKITTAGGKGEAFNVLLQLLGIWLLGESFGRFFGLWAGPA